jgi:hypothetical protein
LVTFFSGTTGKVFLFLPMIQKRKNIAILDLLTPGLHPLVQIRNLMFRCSFYYITHRFMNNSKNIIFRKLLFTRDDIFADTHKPIVWVIYLFTVKK